ncbi:NitT/TauT family transport system permease protein [Thermosporothrix hazakensis]|jgi:NitT/TauT family transport system permease protein|uniref:NitT/TauT family transport system permease protein n=2 Tax=Thermosporothrix hazakensis TaxID=644383 RepID=A0A326U8G8_THEHA|nr:ABC transporter permease subunit [Thermosporothrix hazakensis]PZW29485.1 NitT/TauT family transport system permease protein [Thermosporothrix hazakensis]GCE45800.1 hypothetical protein KTH_06690 [Thermosporothrix hazakensis]
MMRFLLPAAGSLKPERYFSRWDFVIIPLFMVLLALLTIAFKGASRPFDEHTPDLLVSLDPVHLPYYGLRTIFRMLIAVLCSLLFTFLYATVAAKSRKAEKVLIPILDFLQSLPILGFLTVTTTIFLGLFHGNMLGLEAASIFAIFTSQVWNMTFSFYHSLVTVPKELKEAAAVLRLSAWQKFWKLEVPFSMQGLIWNTMMSVSGGWFFVVASEVISVVGRDHSQYLPGLGSYIALAIDRGNIPAMVYAALALLLLVLLYDQLAFRPIVAWSDKFKFEQSGAQEKPGSWMLTLIQRSRFLHTLARFPATLFERVTLSTGRGDRPGKPLEQPATTRRSARWTDALWNGVILLGFVAFAWMLAHYMLGPSLGFANGRLLQPNPNLNTGMTPEVARQFQQAGVTVGQDQTVYLSNVCAASKQGTQISPALNMTLHASGVATPANLQVRCAEAMTEPGQVAIAEIGEAIGLGLLTMLRVAVMIVIAALIWVPVGVWIGLRPRLAQSIQPLAQFLAAFPANLLFPLAVVLIAHFSLNPEIWLSPLIVLGTQWYILFNVIAGTLSIPNDLKESARVMGLRPWGWLWWKKLIIPGVFPSLVTGGITASGGSWNASIVAEVVSWGSTTLVATGLGAFIARWSTGEFNPHVALGMLIMGLLVLTFNRLLWRRLYRLAEERFSLA